MKKFSIVLLALLLAGGFAFAADLTIDGEASSSLVLDFQNNTYGMDYAPDQDLSLTFSAEASSEGEGDVYGVISITDAELAFASDDATALEYDGWTFDGGDLEAKIVGPDWEVIFGSPDGLGNANAPDMDQDGDTDSEDTVSPGLTRGEGLTIKYSDLTLGVDFMYDTSTAPDFEYLAYVAYAAELADGVNADVAFAVNDGDFAGTVAATAEVEGVALDAAFDMEYTTSFAWDASVGASYAMDALTADVAAYWDGDLDVFAKLVFTGVEKAELTAWGYVNNTLDASAEDASGGETLADWAAGVEASYDIDDVYSAYAEVGYDSNQDLPVTVGLDAALISNAAVNLEYATDDAADFANNKGSLTASVTIEL
jgi:hypothetical protein